jgi:hypothetical protein
LISSIFFFIHVKREIRMTNGKETKYDLKRKRWKAINVKERERDVSRTDHQKGQKSKHVHRFAISLCNFPV